MAGRFLDFTVDDFRELLEVNFLSTVRTIQAFLPAMIEDGYGKIVNIASTAGKYGSMFQSPYNSSKHAAVGLGAETIVPGHGKICGPEAIEEVGAYLEFLQGVAQEGFDVGLTPLELARQTDLGSIVDLTDSERPVGSLHRAYSELRGEPSGVALALPPIIGDMQSLIVGPIVSHA